MYRIAAKRALNDSVTLMEVEAPLVARKARAGQFIILRTDPLGERIPLTIADRNPEKGTVTIIFQRVGHTTELLNSLNEGDFLEDLVGPLGHPSDFSGVKRAAVIGGGVGCAIAYPAAKELKRLGIPTDVIAGFRSKDIVILEDEMRAVADNYYVTTDDGTYGEKGFVTDKLRSLIEGGNGYDLVIAIGPVIMMKMVSQVTRPYGIHTVVSLNPIMVDGTGMCGCCRVTVGGETRFSCVDGPEFDGHQVDFDELMKRNGLYKEQEAEAKSHVCRLTGGVRNG